MNQDDVEAVVQTGEARKFRPLHELLEEDGAILTVQEAMEDFQKRLTSERVRLEAEEIKS